MNLTIEQYEALNPHAIVPVAGKRIVYCTPNRIARWRVETLLTKEPDTVAWIRDEFKDGDVFVDIGANVGMYSILAATLHPGIQVCAFEPEAQNFALLNQNIAANRLGNVTAWCLALSDKAFVGTLALAPDTRAGRSGHQLDVVGLAGHQGIYSETLDRLVWREKLIPPPTHIKIDVDGLEQKILAGARATLVYRGVQSVLVEVDRSIPEHAGIITMLQGMGYVTDESQVQAALRKDGPCKGVGNVIFRRPRTGLKQGEA